MPLADCGMATNRQLEEISRGLEEVRTKDRTLSLILGEALAILEDLKDSALTDPECEKPETRFQHGRLSAALNILRATGLLPPRLYDFALDRTALGTKTAAIPRPDTTPHS